MNKADRNALIAFPVIVLLGLLMALAGSQGGTTYRGMPVFALAVGSAFLIQWLAFIPAYLWQTEKFFDLTGSLTYLLIILMALFLSGNTDTRSILLSALVSIWAIRLGTFLFSRI